MTVPGIFTAQSPVQSACTVCNVVRGSHPSTGAMRGKKLTVAAFASPSWLAWSSGGRGSGLRACHMSHPYLLPICLSLSLPNFRPPSYCSFAFCRAAGAPSRTLKHRYSMGLAGCMLDKRQRWVCQVLCGWVVAGGEWSGGGERDRSRGQVSRESRASR